MNLIVRLGNCGVIHGDFNEFNVMITDDAKPILIDFPQMISTSHENAKQYFDRDVNCVRQLFRRKFGYESTDYPTFDSIQRTDDIDIEVSCSGFTKEMEEDLLRVNYIIYIFNHPNLYSNLCFCNFRNMVIIKKMTMKVMMMVIIFRYPIMKKLMMMIMILIKKKNFWICVNNLMPK